MNQMELTQALAISNETKIIMLVIDGLGGLPDPSTGKTELETAQTPNLDALASRSSCGLNTPVLPGITPGSGPAHLSLFGYDPIEYQIGRGILGPLGIGFELQPGDVAARVNFATMDNNGLITDRRAGRIATELCTRLCEKLSQIKLTDVEVFIKPEKDYRAALIFRGEGLHGELSDTDPQKVGLPPKEVTPLVPEARSTADLANEFVRQAKDLLADEQPANMIMLRGFDEYKPLPQFPDTYKMRAASIATYPMYKGVTRLLGMEVIDCGGETLNDELATLKKVFNEYDFFYFHVKKTDSAGEDGNFAQKVSVLEDVDKMIPHIEGLNPEVIVVTGDHSTPAILKAHSWHPLPLLIASRWSRPSGITNFSETQCGRGPLGVIPSTTIMTLAMAHAQRLEKFGA